MNTKNIFTLLAGVALVGILLTFKPEISKANFNDSYGLKKLTATNLPTVITGGATSNQTSIIAFPSEPARGFTIFNYFAGTNAATVSAMSVIYTVSQDGGTTFSTTRFTNTTDVANGATGVRSCNVNLPTTITGVNAINIVTLINGNASTNSLFLTNTIVSWW